MHAVFVFSGRTCQINEIFECHRQSCLVAFMARSHARDPAGSGPPPWWTLILTWGWPMAIVHNSK